MSTDQAHPPPLEPADLVVKGAEVATLDDDWTVIERGGVAVRSDGDHRHGIGRIVAVGPDDELQKHIGPQTELVDATGQILIPGLVNAHCHAGDTLFRGLVENLPLEPWLESVWTAERATLDASNTEIGALLGFAENLLSGVTTVIDMFWHPAVCARAARRLGLRVCTGGMFFDGPGMDGLGPEDRPAEAEAFYDEFDADPLVLAGVFPHATYTVGPESLALARDLWHRHGGVFSTHAAETRIEQKTVQERFGTSVIRHLDALDLLGEHVVLAHCVHLDDHEISRLAETRTCVAHNPISNLKLGSGIAPIPDLLAAGVPVALGTDGAISGNDLDPWLALRTAALLHKGVREDATVVTVQQALRMATCAAAPALGLDGEIGQLRVGARADLVLLDTIGPHAAPRFDLHNHLAYAAGRGDVHSVWVDGRRVVCEGRLVNADVAKLTESVRALEERISASLR